MKFDPSTLPSPQRLQEVFSYEPDTGTLRWKINFHNRHAGDVAGRRKLDGYRYVEFEGRCYCEHRVVWAVAFGQWPTATVDHINMARDDNRLTNLRLASIAENNRNRPRQTNNTSGFKGVSFNSRARKFQARVTVNKVRVHLGLFETAEEAAAAYSAKAGELHGEFYRSGPRSPAVVEGK